MLAVVDMKLGMYNMQGICMSTIHSKRNMFVNNNKYIVALGDKFIYKLMTWPQWILARVDIRLGYQVRRHIT